MKELVLWCHTAVPSLGEHGVGNHQGSLVVSDRARSPALRLLTGLR